MLFSLVDSKGFGKLGYRFRFPSATGAAIFIIVYHLQEGNHFNWFDILVLIMLAIIPHAYLVWYNRSGYNKGLAFRQIQLDLLLSGIVAGSMQVTLVPSMLYCLAVISTYIAVRGFNKMYRLLYIPAGIVLALLLQQEPPVWESSQLMINLVLGYFVIHFLVLSFMSYRFARNQHEGLRTISEQKKEIELKSEEVESQAEELELLNESLQSLNMSLEEKVKERTLQLEERKQQLTEYAFLNANKLGVPTANIAMLTELLDNTADSEQTENVIERINVNTQGLDTVVREIQRNLNNENRDEYF